MIVPLLLGFALTVTVVTGNEQDQSIELLKQGFQELQQSRRFPEYLNDTLKQLQVPHFFRSSDPADIGYKVDYQLDNSVICTVCYTVANFLIGERRSNVSLDVIALEAAAACTLLGIETAEVCKGVIDLNLPIFGYIIDTNSTVTGERICDLFLQNTGCNSTTFEWTIDIPEGKTVPRKPQSNPEKTFNVLHISDFHYDPRYTPGKSKSCSEPLCCQNDQGDGSTTDGTACGYWSEYHHADSSEALVNETIKKANEFEFEYVYFTGDIVNHRVWSTSVENNTRDLKLVFRKMKSAFAGKPIYPVIGNHEPNPVNEFPLTGVSDASLSSEWLYRLIVSEFSQWLPKSAKQELMRGGYFSVSPQAGLRVISMNTNLAYVENWWLNLNDVDPLGQLSWLAQTLKEAEDHDEIVHILAHIPSGKSDLLKVWSREYHKIIERFSNTIAAQFYGHTHKDQFQVYYSSSNVSEAVNVALNGASVIPDVSNPSFKIINVDSSNFDVIDTHEWTFNLTQANADPNSELNWYELYAFRESFGVKSLAPSELGELVARMAVEHNLLDDYHIYRYRNSDAAVESGCDNSCKKNYLCEIATSQVGDSTQCAILSEIFDQHV